jgi:phosphatidylinositol-3-phosphatase
MCQSTFPKPDHIVIAILESHGYSQLIGSTAAPYINYLANNSSSALFSESYAFTHPSQPNYQVLFSGSNQEVIDNNIPMDIPFTTPNLGRQLIDSGKTFKTYSEDLPEAGFNGATSDLYARKHNPVTNWMGTGKNQVSPATNQPFKAFPSGNFNLLPTVCYVVPNLKNNMHNGTDPSRIRIGDKWL